MTTITELDFRSEYLFCTYSVAHSLVTSVELNSIRCATMLCQFGQTRNGSMAIHFILCGSTAMSSATGDYVVVPERFGLNEEPADSNEARTREKPFFSKSGFNRCSITSDM